MADQRPWWKLWVSALSDDDLMALSLEDFARWAMLGAHLKLHGEGGSMTCSRPGQALAKLWRVSGHALATASTSPRWEACLAVARRLPGVVVEVITTSPDGLPESIRVSMKNWKKYQEDSSAERTKEWRRRQRERDGTSSSHSDADKRHNKTDGDDATASRGDGVEEKRSRRDPPTPLRGQASQSGPDALCTTSPLFRNEHPKHWHRNPSSTSPGCMFR